jgi:preprotein translocase subunit SecF
MTSLAVLLLSFVVLGAYFVALQRPIDRFFLRHRATDPTIRQRLLLVAGIVTALAADVWVVMMSMSLLGIEVSLPVIAAVLTIIGYSVNDSVVLCSHLQRRWTSAAGGQGSSPLEEVTAGVDTILGRAVLTSLSTLIPAVAVLTVGLEPLADFAWVIIIGIVAGTLSSIFIVGSFVLRAMSAEVNGAGGHDSA